MLAVPSLFYVINKNSERVRESGKNYKKKFLKKRRDLQKNYVYVYRSKKIN